MIAESQTTVCDIDLSAQFGQSGQLAETEPLLSLKRMTAVLQVALPTRRAARNEEHAYWYNLLRGM